MKCSVLLCLFVLCIATIMDIATAAPHPRPEESQAVEAEDLDTGARAAGAEGAEKDDLQSSSSIGYGYYDSPYYGGYYGGYYPYYSGYYGGFGYPQYSHYGGYHHLGHYGHYW
ncbi:glycine and tyrosine-rich protein-like [Teleopsis dalmanni]|uniref:glycine and tyrosine-rich protein-like n=1 Tax=Teleopsis dalmanni TaxID=139649 RepID=UPI000D32A6C0|nr:glycine and tyrosine-rich protein-like [Teleopsis dalmanni]XP_037940365.1 glycine and tyrosine-rich protein-like [Teleopsis dalmanni]